MDMVKRDRLIARLSKAGELQIVPVEEFFDGNDDLGSIGGNLIEHPGIDVFRETLIGIARRADVVAVYAAIAEVDPGVGSWPFADTIFVVGTIPRNELAEILSPLQPDEIGTAEDFGAPEALTRMHGAPATAAWWD